MKCILKLALMGLWLSAGSCREPTATAAQPPAQNPPAANSAKPALTAAKATRAGTSDSLDMCYKPFPQQNPQAFFKAQRLPFQRSVDTVVNDERGLFLGPKFVLGSSYAQWDDQNRVTRLFIDDARVRLSHGLRVGALWDVLQQFGWRGRRDAMPDTFSIDCGFLANGADLIVRQGRLASVSLVNEAD